MISYSKNYRQNAHNATAITTGSANQRPNTPCIRLWIDVTFRGLENSYKYDEYGLNGMRHKNANMYGAED